MIVGAYRNSLSDWGSIYKEQDFDGLCKIRYSLNQSLLEKEASSFKELFMKHPPRSIDEAKLKIKELTGTERSNI